MGWEVRGYRDMFSFFCNTADVEWGKFRVPDGEVAEDLAYEFVRYIGVDPRGVSSSQLYGKYAEFLDKRYSTENNGPLLSNEDEDKGEEEKEKGEENNGGVK